MPYSAALLVGLAGLWMLLAPAPFAPPWILAGIGAAALVWLFAWRLDLLDREGAPYGRLPAFALFVAGRAGGVFAANVLFARAAQAGDMALHPALVRLKTRQDDESVAAFANAAALGPGILAIESAPDSLLLHALMEDDADEAELRDLEDQARRAAGAAPA